MLCPLLVKIDGKKSHFVECQREECYLYDTGNKSCILPNIHKFLIDFHLISSRTKKSIISTLNKNTDELIYHQNESGRRIYQLMEESTENYVKINQDLRKVLQQSNNRLQNLGSTLYGILSDQKDGRKLVLNQLGEVVRKLEVSIQTVQQTASDSRTTVEQLQDVIINLADKFTNANNEIIDTINRLIKKNEEILIKNDENNQILVRHIKNISELFNTSVSQQQEFSQNLENKLNEIGENTSKSREMIDRRLGEYLAAQRSFIATRIERSNEEVRLMSEVYKNNRKMLELMKETRDMEQQKKQEKKKVEADKHNETGIELFHRKAYEAAMKEFKIAVELNPDLLYTKNNLALVLYRMGKLDEAIEKFKEIQESNPEFIGSYINLAYCYYTQKDYEQAIEVFNQALGMDGNRAEIYNGLGQAYYQLDQYNDAIKAWQQALELDSTLHNAKNKLEIFQV